MLVALCLSGLAFAGEGKHPLPKPDPAETNKPTLVKAKTKDKEPADLKGDLPKAEKPAK